MDMTRIILILCPHNADKSVLAAGYCPSSARERRLHLRHTSAGTDPAGGVSLPVLDALREDGVDLSGYRPRCVTPEEIATPWRISSLGCELAKLPPTGAGVERAQAAAGEIDREG